MVVEVIPFFKILFKEFRNLFNKKYKGKSLEQRENKFVATLLLSFMPLMFIVYLIIEYKYR
jgi:hypothetical protein